MATDMQYNISPQVHRTLYMYSIKNFLKNNIKKYDDFISKSEINHNADYYYNKLLDRAINQGLVSATQVQEFLISELNYGLLKNLYIYPLQDTTHLEEVKNIKSYINSLGKFYDVGKISEFPYINKINMSSERNKTELVYSNLGYEEDKITSITLLFSKGILYSSNETNYYIGIEINLKYKLLVIKLRDHLDERNKEAKMHKVQNLFKHNIVNCFALGSIHKATVIQKLVFNMTFDLTHRVLNPTIKHIDSHLSEHIDKQIKDWNSLVIDKSFEMTPKDTEGLKTSILNNYYRLYMQNIVGKISNTDLKNKYKVSGYLRTVKFIDDTIGEGKVKSSSSKESLLDNSTYYDIKTRLDHSKEIKFSTIYWIDIPNTKESVGTTFHVEPNGRFRCNILPNYFNKEICDYVLQKIAKYLPKP